MPRIGGDLDVVQLSADPSIPSPGRAKLYFKSDGKLYRRTSDGTITEVAGGSGGGGGTTVYQQAEPTAGWPAGTLWIDTDENAPAGASPPVETYIVSATGQLKVQTGKSRVYFEQNYEVVTMRAAVNSATDGYDNINAAVRHRDVAGNIIATTTLSIPAPQNVSPVYTSGTFMAGSYMTVDITQVGGSLSFINEPGSDLTVTIRLKPVS